LCYGDYLFLAEIEKPGLNGLPRLGSQFQAKKSLDSHSAVCIPKKVWRMTHYASRFDGEPAAGKVQPFHDFVKDTI